MEFSPCLLNAQILKSIKLAVVTAVFPPHQVSLLQPGTPACTLVFPRICFLSTTANPSIHPSFTDLLSCHPLLRSPRSCHHLETEVNCLLTCSPCPVEPFPLLHPLGPPSPSFPPLYPNRLPAGPPPPALSSPCLFLTAATKNILEDLTTALFCRHLFSGSHSPQRDPTLLSRTASVS